MSFEKTMDVKYKGKGLGHIFHFLALCGITGLVLFIIPSLAFAANYSINPTSMVLQASAKSGAFTVINSGDEIMNCKIDVKEWNQDADGKDVYIDTQDMIFFPKIMTLDANEQRAIRVGIKVPAGAKEKTYRLFVEEIPSPKKVTEDKTPAKQITAGLTIAIRYAVPIFVIPVKTQQSAVVEKVSLSKGVATAIIKNTGNIHIKLISVTFKGKASDGRELFSKDIAGWYILQGVLRQYETTVPKGVCNDLATIEVNAQAENFTVNGTMNADRSMCTK
jgi:fimbrial chaperone protein